MKFIFAFALMLILTAGQAQDSLKNAVADTMKLLRPDSAGKIFTKVNVEAYYSGGKPAWNRFLGSTLKYPDDAVNNMIQGTVVVQFTVDDQGNVADVHAISGPTKGGLREEAVRVLKLSGKWVPAVQNGKAIRSVNKRPIVFKLSVS